MRAGLTALISAALTALVLIAILPQIAPNAPYLPKATTTKTETLTKTATLTTTTTQVSTATLTQTITQTKTLPTTTTLTTTEVRTATKTLTKTRTTTQTITTTTTATITITKTIIESTFQYLSKPDKVIQLITKTNKTLIIYIPYALLNGNWEIFSPTVGKILNATLQVYEQRRIDAYVVVAYDPVCKIPVNDTFTKYLNRLNATLPPKHVLEAKDEYQFYTYPFRQHFLAIIMIDGKYMALIESGLHPPTNDTRHTYIIYNPQAINKTMSLALKILRNFDNPNFDNGAWIGYIWVWDGCKKHESPWG